MIEQEVTSEIEKHESETSKQPTGYYELTVDRQMTVYNTIEDLNKVLASIDSRKKPKVRFIEPTGVRHVILLKGLPNAPTMQTCELCGRLAKLVDKGPVVGTYQCNYKHITRISLIASKKK